MLNILNCIRDDSDLVLDFGFHHQYFGLSLFFDECPSIKFQFAFLFGFALLAHGGCCPCVSLLVSCLGTSVYTA